MPAPKVFVSSTCFDLREVRESLCAVIKAYGFEPVLSEKGDVFYHPDLHTHEACVHEVSNCQLFILLIGGRFGGTYISDKTKSITNAEYEAAVKSRIPIFTYIKKAVLDNHHMYQSNKNKSFINEMTFPAIQEPEDAKNIFEFINLVRKSSVNNAYEPFETSIDIEVHLRKQWASMFFDFLKNRALTLQINQNSQAIDGLKSATDKLEELIKSMYKSVDKTNADDEIANIETVSLAKEFFSRYFNSLLKQQLNAASEEELKKLSKIEPNKYTWHKYLATIIGLEEKEAEDDTEEITYMLPEFLIPENFDGIWGFGVFPESSTTQYQKDTANAFKHGVCKLNEEQRYNIFREFSDIRPHFES